MAEGWESKSVDPAEAARQARRATLMLARTRALSDLQLACAPARRAMLEQAIADLDETIRGLQALGSGL